MSYGENDKARELLKSVDVGNYMLDTKELVTAKFVQTYLGEQAKESAWKLIQEVVEDTVCSYRLEKMIQKASPTWRTQRLWSQQRYTILSVKLELLHSEAVAVRKIALQVIEGINGKQTVENITLGFLCFLADCYKALR